MIEVIGDKVTADDLRHAGNAFARSSDDVLHDIGRYTVGRVKAYTLDAGAVDRGELVQGISDHHEHGFDYRQVVVKPSPTADQYATYVEHGTRPHTPPVSALQGWADRHGIPVWAVVRKIQREGTEPRYMWRDTFNDLLGRAEQYARAFAEQIGRRI